MFSSFQLRQAICLMSQMKHEEYILALKQWQIADSMVQSLSNQFDVMGHPHTDGNCKYLLITRLLFDLILLLLISLCLFFPITFGLGITNYHGFSSPITFFSKSPFFRPLQFLPVLCTYVLHISSVFYFHLWHSTIEI